MTEILEMPQNDTVGFRIDGEITEQDITRVKTALAEKSTHPAPFRLYVEYETVDNFSLNLLFEDAQVKSQYLNDFKKAVIVTDQAWFEPLVKLSDALTDIELKTFDFSQKEEALQWLAR